MGSTISLQEGLRAAGRGASAEGLFSGGWVAALLLRIREGICSAKLRPCGTGTEFQLWREKHLCLCCG